MPISVVNLLGNHGNLEKAKNIIKANAVDITPTDGRIASDDFLTAQTARKIGQSDQLQFRQIAILRYGALGTVFLFIFIAATSMVVFFDRRRLYCALQMLFCGLNFALTALTASWGEDYYGVGYFAAAFVSAAVAIVIAERTFEKLNYLTFIGNNPSIAGAPGGFWLSLGDILKLLRLKSG